MTPAQAKIKAWREDPVLFVREQFGVEPDLWQIDALRAFADPSKQRIGMKACAGPGKSAVLAWCGWNFLACYARAGEHPKGAALSVTEANLRNGLWPEMAKWRYRSQYLQEAFEWTKERCFSKEKPADWFLEARSFAKSANPEEQGRTLSGLHSEYILYLIDESGDINPSVLRAAEQGLSNCKWGKILQAGNPTSQTGMLYESSNSRREDWHLITITADPDDPKRTPRVPVEFAAKMISDHGRENAWVMAYILGQFPPTAMNALLSIQEVEAAMGKHLKAPDYEWSQRRLGVDIALYGDDRTVLFPRQGLAAFPPVEMRNALSNQIAARILIANQNWPFEVEILDSTGGWADGVLDSLRVAGRSPMGVLFNGPAANSQYGNKRSEMYLEMSKWVKAGGALPPCPPLVAELTTPTYSFTNGKFWIEPKELIKKRLGRSPDYADSLALTFAIPDQPAAISIGYDSNRGKPHMATTQQFFPGEGW